MPVPTCIKCGGRVFLPFPYALGSGEVNLITCSNCGGVVGAVDTSLRGQVEQTVSLLQSTDEEVAKTARLVQQIVQSLRG
jgi:hypothetical protein